MPMRLFSWLLGAPGASEGLSERVEALERRIAAVEGTVADCVEVVQLEAERATRWADMSQQLRRFLGRLDAHAANNRAKDEDTDEAASKDPKQLAAILRSKYPNAGV